jgi:NNP family nitrate/nitrite transporter-like MFS transporter
MRVRDFARSGHWPTLLMSFLYFDVSFMIWVLLGVLGIYVAKDFNLTPGQKGLMVALPILGGSLVRLPMGILVDRIGSKRTGILGQLLVLIPLFWGWQAASSLPQVLVLGMMLGIAGGSFAVALPLASRWYPPQHQGLAMGIAGAGNSGTVLTALFAPRLAEWIGWHGVFGLALLPVTVTLALFTLFAKESPVQPAPKLLKDYLAILKKRDLLRFCLLYSFTFGGFVGMASFLVIFFHDQYGVAKVTAGTLTALCVMSGSFMRPVGGYLADRFGGVRALIVLFGAAGLGFLSLSFLPSLWTAAPLIFLTMAMLGLGNGSVFQLVPQKFRKEIGVATGVVGAAGGLGGFLLPSMLGVFKQASGTYGAGFAVLGLAGILGFAFLLRQRREWLASVPPEPGVAVPEAQPVGVREPGVLPLSGPA